MATEKTIKIVVKGTEDIVELNKEVKQLEKSSAKTVKSLEKMGKVDVSNKSISKLDKDLDSVKSTAELTQHELEEIGNANVNNPGVSKLNKELKELTKSTKEQTRAEDSNTKSKKSNTSATNSNSQAQDKAQAEAKQTTKANLAQAKSYNSLSDSVLSFQTNLSFLAVGSAMAISSFQQLDATVRELTYQFTFNAETMQASSVGMADLATSATEATSEMAALHTMANITSFTLEETAVAMLDLAKAGMDATEATGILVTSMKVAELEGTNLMETTHALMGVVNAFGLQLKTSETAVEDFNKVVTGLIYTADATANSVNDLIYGMRYMAPVANAVGMSMSDCAAAVAALGEAGLEASKGARTLASGMLSLVDPTEEAAAMMNDLGIELYDAQGAFIGFPELVGQLETALGGLSQEAQAVALSTLFGKEALKSWNAILEFSYGEADTAAESFQILSDEIAAVGDSAEYLDKKFAQITLGFESTEEMDAWMSKWKTNAEEIFGDLDSLLQAADDNTQAWQDFKKEFTGDVFNTILDQNPAKAIEIFTAKIKDLSMVFAEDLVAVVAELAQKYLPDLLLAFQEIDDWITDFLSRRGVETEGQGEWIIDEVAAIATVLTILGGAIVLLTGAVKKFLIPGVKMLVILKLLVKLKDKLEELEVTFEELANAVVLCAKSFLAFKIIRWVTRQIGAFGRFLDKSYKFIDGRTGYHNKKMDGHKNDSVSSWKRFADDIVKLLVKMGGGTVKILFGTLNGFFKFSNGLKITGVAIIDTLKRIGKGFIGFGKGSAKGLFGAFKTMLKGFDYTFKEMERISINGLNKLTDKTVAGFTKLTGDNNKVIKSGLTKSAGTVVKGLGAAFIPFVKWIPVIMGGVELINGLFEKMGIDVGGSLIGIGTDLQTSENDMETYTDNVSNLMGNMIENLGLLINGEWKALCQNFGDMFADARDTIGEVTQDILGFFNDIIAGFDDMNQSIREGGTIGREGNGVGGSMVNQETVVSGVNSFTTNYVPQVSAMGNANFYASDIGSNAGINSSVNTHNTSNVDNRQYIINMNGQVQQSSLFDDVVSKLRGL